MKKILALLLAAVMCLSLVACGGKGKKEDIYLKEVGNGYYLNFPSAELFTECIVKVDITRDNWQEYFEDYEYTEHIVETNDFGDVEREYDVIYRGFGLKPSILGLVDKLSFKFDGVTEYLVNNNKLVKKANQETYKVYNCATNELIEEKPLQTVKDYYLIEFQNSNRTIGDIHVSEHNFMDVIGTIYIIDIPEGLYNGQNIWQVDFGPDGSEGGTGFGVGNILLYYKE